MTGQRAARSPRLCRDWRVLFAALMLGVQSPALAQDWALEFGGHGKGQFIWTRFPTDSVFWPLAGDHATDLNGELRLTADASRGLWDVKADYQFIAVYSDTLALTRERPGSVLPLGGVINDDRRWFDLTHTIEDDGKRAVVQRLDRLSLGLTTEHTAWRFGRQAISWGNGLVFTPMDIFNPFDPAAVDKEYKTGDDMLYGQWLFSRGSDLQAVAVVRRDPISGNTDSSQSSVALKYHGFHASKEFDLLGAEHFGDRVLGLGGNVSWGGAIWRGDLVWTATDTQEVLSGVISASYSWTWGDRNWSGVLEYFYNGFGQRNGAYGAEELRQNPDLLRRLERGEVFSLGRHYLAASATVEITPLFLLVPNAFINLADPSALIQLVGQYDWRQDFQFLMALNFPLGAPGTEYGGIDSDVEDSYLSTGPSLFAQLAWYF